LKYFDALILCCDSGPTGSTLCHDLLRSGFMRGRVRATGEDEVRAALGEEVCCGASYAVVRAGAEYPFPGEVAVGNILAGEQLVVATVQEFADAPGPGGG